MNNELKHGIAIRERKTNKLIEFIKCSPERALTILSGVRRQMDNKRYKADETFLSDSEIKKC